MPLGNGAPGGLASLPLGIYSDLRTYDVLFAGAGDTGFSTISKPCSGPISPYEKVIASTPGLAVWWPFDRSKGGHYLNSAGSQSLIPAGTGSDKLVTGIVPGSRNRALYLSGGRYLTGLEYSVWAMSGSEINMSVEFWIRMDALVTDNGLIGAYDSGANGWMVYQGTTQPQIYAAGNGLVSPVNWQAGKVYHVVGVWGGSNPPTADWVSRLYLNGVQVASGNLVAASGKVPYTGTATGFQINKYDSNSDTCNMTIQHVSIYNRMLQPLEVKQHYQAGFARA